MSWLPNHKVVVPSVRSSSDDEEFIIAEYQNMRRQVYIALTGDGINPEDAWRLSNEAATHFVQQLRLEAGHENGSD